MKQKKTILFSCLLFSLCSLQLSGQHTVLASGHDASGSGGSMSYSIGQIDYIETTGSGGFSSEGVQQAYEIFELIISNPLSSSPISIENNFTALSIYPNPTTRQLVIRQNTEPSIDMFYVLHDTQGRLIKKERINSQNQTILMEELTAATYFLNIMDGATLIKTFKIIKK